MEIKTLADFEGHIMNQLTKTLEGLDNLLELGLINPIEYAENVKKARLIFEAKFTAFKKSYKPSFFSRFKLKLIILIVILLARWTQK